MMTANPFIVTTLLLQEKTIRLLRRGDGKLDINKKAQGFLTFEPNHYNLPVTDEVFQRCEVGRYYNLDLKEVEPPE